MTTGGDTDSPLMLQAPVMRQAVDEARRPAVLGTKAFVSGARADAQATPKPTLAVSTASRALQTQRTFIDLKGGLLANA